VPWSSAPPRSSTTAAPSRSLRDCARRSIRLVANEPDARDAEDYREKLRQIVDDHDLPNAGDIIFIEVTLGHYSDPESRIEVHGEVLHEQFRALTVTGASVPNTPAALLLDIRDRTGVRPPSGPRGTLW
jgi:hypothetical protein